MNVRGLLMALLFGALATLFACEATLPTISIDSNKKGRMAVNNLTDSELTVLKVNGDPIAAFVPPGQHDYLVTIHDRLGDGREVRSQSVSVTAESVFLGASEDKRVTIYTDGRTTQVEFEEDDFPNRPRN